MRIQFPEFPFPARVKNQDGCQVKKAHGTVYYGKVVLEPVSDKVSQQKEDTPITLASFLLEYSYVCYLHLKRVWFPHCRESSAYSWKYIVHPHLIPDSERCSCISLGMQNIWYTFVFQHIYFGKICQIGESQGD